MPRTQLQSKRSSILNSLMISGEDRVLLIEHMAMLLGADMDVLQILSAIESDTRSGRLKRIIADIRADVSAGAPLWEAVERSQLFPSHVVSLLRIGEQSGRLRDNLHSIAIGQRKEREFKSRIRSALLYPVFILAFTLVIGLGIAWFILPKLSTVFDDLDVPLPWITQALLAVGNFFSVYGAIAVPVIIGLMLGLLYLFFGYKHTRFIGQSMLFVLPGVRRLIQDIEISRMTFMLGTLLGAGLSIVEALNAVTGSTTFFRYRRLYATCSSAMNDGQSLKTFFGEYPHMHRLIPSTIQQFIIAGEQSGHLSDSLMHIATLFEEKIANATKNLSVVLEPVLLVVVWFGVVIVALAVVLPVYSLIGSLDV